MKKLILLFITFLLFMACGNDAEKQAAVKLQSARAAIETGDYTLAKTEIDSIKLLYPKAIEARKAGMKLMQQVELKEQVQTVAYLDSLLAAKTMAYEAIKGRFIFKKDTAYQDIGNYFSPTQVVEKNLHRSFLRFQVDERGQMSMTSIYCGASHIHHVAVKVIAPDGTFAETPASNDSYETSDLGEKIEKADFPMGEDGNVMAFIYLNNDNNLRVEYQGERKYATTLSSDDRRALKELYELSQLLSTIQQATKEREEALLKKGFIARKIEEDLKKETPQ